MAACEICKKPYVPPSDDGSFDSNEKPHVCNICGKSFSLKIQLKRHVLSHEGDVPYICHMCEKHLENTSYNLRLSKKGNFTCETCSKCFPSKRLLLRHASDHTAENLLHCDECGESFKSVTALKKHTVIHRRKRGPVRGRPPKEEPLHVCGDCGKSFSQLWRLEKHRLTHKHRCTACCTDFTSDDLLEEHHRASATCQSAVDNSAAGSSSASLADNDSNTDGKKHVCDICNQSFARKSALEGHVASHFTDGRESTVEDDSDIDVDFQCNYKSDKSSEQPKRQCLPKLKIRRTFRCEKCGVVCASKKSFDNHMASHEIAQETKNYTCRTCNEAFDSKEDYKKHKLSHETENGVQDPVENNPKTYKCQLCLNVFCKKRQLRKHLKCHFNIDPNDTSSLSSEDIEMSKRPKKGKIYSCNVCGKRFAGQTCLRKHEAKHMDSNDDDDNKEGISSDSPKVKKEGKKLKNLCCEFCNEDFSGRRGSYVKHKLSHTPEVCGICDARFVDRASLREHCRIHIGTEEGRRFIECSQKALDAKNGVVQPEPKVEYIYLVLR